MKLRSLVVTLAATHVLGVLLMAAIAVEVVFGDHPDRVIQEEQALTAAPEMDTESFRVLAEEVSVLANAIRQAKAGKEEQGTVVVRESVSPEGENVGLSTLIADLQSRIDRLEAAVANERKKSELEAELLAKRQGISEANWKAVDDFYSRYQSNEGSAKRELLFMSVGDLMDRFGLPSAISHSDTGNQSWWWNRGEVGDGSGVYDSLRVIVRNRLVISAYFNVPRQKR